MRNSGEIESELAHIEYARAMLDDRLICVKQERERLQQAEDERLRTDTWANEKTTKRLSGFFLAHGYLIVGLRVGERTKEQYAVAKQIWKARDVLVPFIKSVSAHKKTSFVYETGSLSAGEINSIRNLCELLAARSWMTYKKQEGGFEITPTLTGAQKNFVHYGWSEEITLYLLDRALKEFTKRRPLKYKLFWDVKLKQTHPTVDRPVDMQLDLVAQVGNRFYIFETKSGPILNIDKWVDRARVFGSDEHRFITCTANEKLDPAIFTPFNLFALPSLENQYLEMLESDFKVDDQCSQTPEPSSVSK
jgi:hypothetical protein